MTEVFGALDVENVGHLWYRNRQFRRGFSPLSSRKAKMAKIKPFKGVVYNGAKLENDYSAVMAPPYDVISPKHKEELHRKSEHNVINLILGKDLNSDTPVENKYTRAGKYLREWIAKGVLQRDRSDSFYVYSQEYKACGEKRRRVGFIGLFEIEDPGKNKIFPHEHTLDAPKKDRMKLLENVKCNLSPIFSLYPDKNSGVTNTIENFITRSKPVIQVKTQEETHKLWRMDDIEEVNRISSLMRDRKIFIADGHHRYEVARLYRDMRRKETGYDSSADFVMMYFAAMEPTNDLTIMATHRVIINTVLGSDDEVARKVSAFFNVTPCRDLDKLMAFLDKKADGRSHVFGFFAGNKYLAMELVDENLIDKLVEEPKSRDWKKLDVSILHFGIFKKLLGVKAEEGNVTYVRDADEAEALVKKGLGKAAFLLNSTRVEQLKAVAESGDMMPQKSTYFYPKLLTGLVMNKFD